MSIKNLLTEELTRTLGALDAETPGSEAYANIVQDATPLMDRLIKLEELEIEADKMAIEEQKVAIEEQKIADDQEDRKVKNHIAVASFAVPAAITAVGATVMFILEGKGVIFPTQGERNFISRLFRGK